MYLEYAKNDIVRSKPFVHSYNFLLETFNNTFVHEKWLKPNFGPSNGKKKIGEKVIFSVLVPLFWALTALFVLAIYGCYVCRIWANQGKNKQVSSAEKEKA